MGRTRPPEQPPTEGTNLEEEAAAAVAAILIAGAADIVAAIARKLLALLPAALSGALRASVSRDVAESVVQDPIRPPRRSQDSVRAYTEEIAYRAMYGVKAVQRLGSAALDGDALRKAYEREKGLYARHREAAEQRQKGRALNDAMVAIYGPILSWNHTDAKTKSHRLAHKNAHRANYDTRKPPRATDGLLPGQAMNCHCVPAPPRRGARMLR